MSVESAKAELAACLAESRTAMETLQGDLATAVTDRQTGEEKHEQEMSDLRLDLLGELGHMSSSSRFNKIATAQMAADKLAYRESTLKILPLVDN